MSNNSKDSAVAGHAAVYFFCGAVFGGGADIIVGTYYSADMARVAGLAGFVGGLLIARWITQRYFPD